ncbi:MAG: hypothetical protein IJX34_00805 [Clostridia bacterium]|nr:hypothetical protein [Clostridia bacterium]
MKNVIKKLANGEKTISTKIKRFNLKLEELKELKDKLEVSSENRALEKEYELTYYTKLYDLKNLFKEIEEDNIVYFCNTLDSFVEDLRNKIELL